MSFVSRDMGLMVARGNPRRITRLRMLTGSGVRFINREPGSSARQLFDLLLDQEGIDASLIDGHDRVELTHTAVAAHVASGAVDAAFGSAAAAQQFGLAFEHLVTEEQFLVCRCESLETTVMQNLLDVLRGPHFRAQTQALPGHDASDAGAILTVGAMLRAAARSGRNAA